MLLTLMRAKLHRLALTAVEKDYQGSIAIDQAFLDASGILPHEQVHVYDVDNGNRLITYALPAPRGSGTVSLNGAAARLAHPGDTLIVVAFGQVPAEEAVGFQPRVVLFGPNNVLIETP